MNLENYSHSQTYFDFSSSISDEKLSDFQSIKGRMRCFCALMEKLSILPFAVLYKAYKTFFRAVGVVLGGSGLILTLGTSTLVREFFSRRFTSMAEDLADWVLFPFSVLSFFVKLLIASFFCPRLYFS